MNSHRVYVAFEPTQIKSAKPAEKAVQTYPDLRTLDTDVKLSPLKTSERANIGTFDPTDPSTLKGIGVGAAGGAAARAMREDEVQDDQEG